jgi:cold shock protein
MRHRGKILWFNRARGIGLLDPDDKTQDKIFFHFSALPAEAQRRQLKGQVVSFEIGVHNGRPTATNLQF